MSGETPETTPSHPTAETELSVRDRVVLHVGFPVGEYVTDPSGGRLVLNLGWCRLAGLSLTVEDDPAQDNHREGYVLRRSYPPRP